MKLTTTTIRALTAVPEADDKVYFDERLPGFGLRVRKSGAHSFMIKYVFGGRVRRMVLGPLSALDPGQAFDTAKDLMAQIRIGRDPAVEKAAAHARAAETFGGLLPRFLERQRARLKPRSCEENERYLLTHAKPLHGLAVEGIARRTISDRLAEIEQRSGPAARNRARAALSGYFSWLAREGFVGANPVSFTNKAVENEPRDHVPSDADLRAIWTALDDDEYGTILKLLMLTGARRDEIGGLRWSEIDFDDATITLPPARVKNKREHLIPLSEPALAILKAQPRRSAADGMPRDQVFGRGAERGFRNWSKNKASLDARITKAHHGKALKGWTPHDFRRSLSTALHERFGVPPHVVEVILGHVGGHKGGIAGVYNRSLYLSERHNALERWGAHIVDLVTGKAAKKVVALRGRRR